MTFVSRLGITLAALLLLVAVLLPNRAEELGPALAADDECLATSDAEACTLSALQLRGQKVLAAQGKQDPSEDEEMKSLNPTTTCGGDADLPAAPACYSGTVMVENFAITIKSYQASKGVADLVATGAMPGSVLGASFSKSGRTLAVDGLDAAFEGQVKISSVEYCSSEDQIRVSVTEPLEVVVALARSDCNNLALVMQHKASPPDARAELLTAAQAGASRLWTGECTADTGSSCSDGQCAKSLGPAKCIDGTCQCPSGWCASKSGCVPTLASRSIQTGGTCRVWACSSSRGETTCEHGRCFCKVGHFSSEGVCYPVLDTGSSCKVLPCQRSLGPTDCTQSKCLCQNGYAAVGGRCERLSP